MNKGDLGTERYVHMQVESILAYVATGVSVRDALDTVIRSTLDDQAQVCSMAMFGLSGNRKEAGTKWFRDISDKLKRVRPWIGVGVEEPAIPITTVPLRHPGKEALL